MELEGSDGRPVRERATARVVVLNRESQVLLINEWDRDAPGEQAYWLTPGGGIEAGEIPRDTAVRELAEEIGLEVRPDMLRGPIAQRTVVHAYSDKVLVQPETYFVVNVDAFEVAPTALTDEERHVLLGHRWWTVDELRQTSQFIWPVGLADLIEARATPKLWPISLGTAQESTVPVADLPGVGKLRS